MYLDVFNKSQSHHIFILKFKSYVWYTYPQTNLSEIGSNFKIGKILRSGFT